MGKLILNGVEYSTSGNLYNPVIYSDTEREIGVWRDNKPLYQITYIFNTPQTVNASPAWFDTGITRNDIEHIVKTDGFRADTNYVLLNGGLNGSNNIVVMQTRPTAITDFKGFTIQYTKTADVAGSGNWNTDGIPTHHYSTNEQVIGTWIDSKPLYEKTINYGTLPNTANVAKDVNHNIANVDKIWITDGFATNGTFVNQLNLSGVNNGEWYFGATSTYIRCVTQSDRIAYSAYVTIRYTKTTD